MFPFSCYELELALTRPWKASLVRNLSRIDGDIIYLLSGFLFSFPDFSETALSAKLAKKKKKATELEKAAYVGPFGAFLARC